MGGFKTHVLLSKHCLVTAPLGDPGVLRRSGSAHALSIQALTPRAPLLKAQDRMWYQGRALTKFGRNFEYGRANVQMWEHRR